MKRIQDGASEAAGIWHFTIQHNGESFSQAVFRTKGGDLRTWVAHRSVREEGRHIVMEPLCKPSDPLVSSLEEAIRLGDALIERWKAGDPPATLEMATR